MRLSLHGIEKKVGAETWLRGIDIAPRPGVITVLLGATQAGKTSLMRVMAGLDRPTHGEVREGGRDVTGVPVRERDVAMVYQQFVNYPSFTVAENIASPMKLRGDKDIAAGVSRIAASLRIDHLLDRLPAALSGGQQQRVALARALAKNAPLMLLDEPLVNLDYKLREELRDELAQLFLSSDTTVIYATTEPGEALLMGGDTAVLDQGELLQFGPTAEVFRAPKSLRVARAFSDPPMNLIDATVGDGGVVLPDGTLLRTRLPAGAPARLVVGLRAGAFTFAADDGTGRAALPGTVALAEISGSDTFVHADTAAGPVVAQFAGVHRFAIGERLPLAVNESQVYVYDAAGPLVAAPGWSG